MSQSMDLTTTTQYLEETTASTDVVFPLYLGELTLDTTIWAVFNCILFVCILGGNILTIIAVRTCRRLRTTISNVFICSLAVSDLIVGLTVPYHLAFYVGPSLDHFRKLCLMRFFLIIFACCVSTFTLISIAIDRYIAVVYPLQYRRYMTRRVAYIKITINWLLGAGVASIPLFWNHFDTATQCEFDEILPLWYMAGIITPGYVVIWLLMALLHWRILRVASKQAHQMRHAICGRKPSTFYADWKSVQIVVLIMGSFSICWLPYFVVACGEMFNTFTITPALYKSTLSLAMMNSCLNPIIYAWKNANFRRAFLKLLRCKNPNSCPRELIASQCSVRSQNSPRKHSVLEANKTIETHNLDAEDDKAVGITHPSASTTSAEDLSAVQRTDTYASIYSDDDVISVCGTECGSCVLRKSAHGHKFHKIEQIIQSEMHKLRLNMKQLETPNLPAGISGQDQCTSLGNIIVNIQFTK